MKHTRKQEPLIHDAKLALDVRAQAGESPLWDEIRQGLWWVDVRGPALFFWNPESGENQKWDMPSPIGFVALGHSGTAYVGLVEGIFSFERESGNLKFLMHPCPDLPDTRLNEGRVDRFGDLWFGVMQDKGLSDIGSLWKWRPGLNPVLVRNNIFIPNGLSFDTDSGFATFVDTTDGRIERFQPSQNIKFETFFPKEHAPGKPDGCVRDSQGFIWNARVFGSCVIRISPKGEIERMVQLPTPNPVGVELGGVCGNTLFITTLRVHMNDQELSQFHLSGAVFSYQAPAKGVSARYIND